ncbi:hypothetical protein BDE02_17G005100 [Populus trichocarpa]|nr:hypothetical protein BDE02_17G005100 [Populus trichocarpa]
MGSLVTGVMIHESLLIHDYATPSLHSSAHSLLRKLRHSNLHTGISFSPSLPHNKVSVLKKMAMEYSFDCFLLDDESSVDGVNEITLSWGGIGGKILFLVPSDKKVAFGQLNNLGWIIVVFDVEGAGACESSGVVCISKLEELPMIICASIRKAIGDGVVTVGYIMKPSREEDFAKRGAFPMNPSPNGLMFLPLTFELPLQSQLQLVDIVLHKATDEIISVDLSGSSESSNRITFSAGMQELQRYMEHHSDCFAIDPLDKIYPVLDRLKIQQILLGLDALNKERCRAIRGPHFLKVNGFNDPDLAQSLSEAKLSLPSIVKPQVACGVADAHSMAITFRVQDFKDLNVPLPAIVQEYVDHSSTIFKIYVLGEQVFYAVKKSIPNADVLTKSSERNELRPLLFDSLKSLPTSTGHSTGADSIKTNVNSFDLELVTDAANWLARKLDLTIFGFDVVIQEGTGDHVIVDVNYLPSFKEVPDDIAVPAFWNAIRHKFESRKRR